MCLVAVPLWITEAVPPKRRGVISDINPIFINIGYVSASWIGVGFFYYNNQNSWRAPIAIGCLPCILCLVSLWFIQESPRVLLLQNRPEEAWNVVKSLHTRHGDCTFASIEFEQMKQQILFESTLKSGWAEMFRRPSYRKRLLMTVLLLFTLVSSGVLVINSESISSISLSYAFWSPHLAKEIAEYFSAQTTQQ
jgi:MFS family permease